MKLRSTLLLALFFVSVLASAQVRVAPANPEMCGQHSQQEKVYELNPEFRYQDSIDQIVFQENYETYLETFDPNERALYTIPVVVHVVHLNGEENISNNQICDAIEKLNEDYSMANADLVNTIPDFSGIIGNGNIEFKLATIDPNGNCHSGITRTFSSTTFDTGMSGGGHPIVDAVAAEHGIWPQGQYMSVFVCLDPSGAAGYTYNPGNFFNSNEMYGAIFMRHDYMGVIGTGSSSRRHTISHEAGHWLNLSHLWGSTNSPNIASNCNFDDGVADTPNTIGRQACTQGSSCGSLDNTQNIMEYSPCRTMFSQGQVARMHTALNSNIAGRSNLITAANLLATGVSGPAEICKAEFTADKTLICPGGVISFADNSYHNVTSRSWTFPGGTPNMSNDSVVSVTYDVPGTYAVTIDVTDGISNIVETKLAYITVLPAVGTELPIIESFELLANFPDNYEYFSSAINQPYDWLISENSASSGTKSIFYNNYQFGADRSIVTFESGSIDLSSLVSGEDLEFSFDYAYRKQNVDDDEWLRFYVSKDCGETWSLRKSIHGNLLSNETSNSSFQANSDDFKTVNITNISSSYHVSNFRYRFTFESDGGNNIYLDNINIYGENALKIDESENELKIALYPNPVQNYLQVQLESESLEAYKITNTNGQVITYETQPTLSTERILTIDTEQLSSGVYYISLVNQNSITTKKFIKQ